MSAWLLLGCGSSAPVACPPQSLLREQHEPPASTFECVDAAGELDGPRLRILDGAPIWRQEWRSGRLHGRMDIYEGGRLASSTEWKDGALDGIAEGFHADGSLMWSGRWVQGAPDGVFSFHRPRETQPRFEVELAQGALVWSERQRLTPMQEVTLEGDAGVADGVRMEELADYFGGTLPKGGELAYVRTSATEGFPIAARPAPDGAWVWAVPFRVLAQVTPPGGP